MSAFTPFIAKLDLDSSGKEPILNWHRSENAEGQVMQVEEVAMTTVR